MDIILDTNILFSDFLLRSKDFDVLMDYLRKTDSSIILPQIILDEIKGKYRTEFLERIVKYKNTLKNINLMLAEEARHLPAVDLNVEQEVKEYEAFLNRKLNIKEKSILPYNNDYLPEIAQRAIDRIKPAGSNGQGFRDTLIWLTIKNYCLSTRERQISFISNNYEDFSDTEKVALHPTLVEECQNLNIKVNYFRSVKDFIEKHSTKINHFNTKWVLDNLEPTLIKKLIVEEYQKGEGRVIKALRRRTHRECMGQYTFLHVNIQTFDEPFVYEMLDNEIIVNLGITGEIELEYGYTPEIPWNLSIAEIDKIPLLFDTTTLGFEAFVTVTILENKIEDYRLSDSVLTY